MRLQTASGQNLDLFACDFFEGILERTEGTPDSVFRNLIQATLIEPEATRSAMENALYIITGYYPVIWEPFQVQNGWFWNAQSFYNTASYWGGGLSDPYNFWIEVFVKSPQVSGSFFYNGANTFWNGNLTTQSFWSSNENEILTYNQILAVIDRVKVGGTVPHLTLTFV